MNQGECRRLEFEDAEALAVGTAELIGERLSQAIEERSEARLVLAGGSTPERAYHQLAMAPIDWNRVQIFWGDERCVGVGEPGSNYAMARRSLLTPAGIPEGRVFRIPGEHGAAQAAQEYERTLRSTFEEQRWPLFDLVLQPLLVCLQRRSGFRQLSGHIVEGIRQGFQFISCLDLSPAGQVPL